MPLWSCSLKRRTLKSVKSPSMRVIFSARLRSAFWVERSHYRLRDLSLQVMKYTFIRGGHGAGPSEWGICNDKTMIYSGWSSRGRIRNTLTMIYYLLPVKVELHCSQGKETVICLYVSYWDYSWVLETIEYFLFSFGQFGQKFCSWHIYIVYGPYAVVPYDAVE